MALHVMAEGYLMVNQGVIVGATPCGCPGNTGVQEGRHGGLPLR
jgi:hypothetical protein